MPIRYSRELPLTEKEQWVGAMICLTRQVGTQGPSDGHSGTKGRASTDQAMGIYCPCGVHRVPKSRTIIGHFLQIGGNLLNLLVLVKKQKQISNNIYKITFVRYETICNKTIIFSILCRILELSHPDANTWAFIRSFIQMAIFLGSVWLYS